MRTSLLIASSVLLTACGGGGGGTSAPVPVPIPPAAPTYTLGGSITGLEASGLTLANGADTLRPAPGDTRFTFAQKMHAATPYAVSVAVQPLGFQLCRLTGPFAATIADGDVSAIALGCGAASASVSTLAGGDNAQGGYVDPSTSNGFSNPYHIAVDAAGTIYVADNGNSVIRKISGGVVTTFAGSVSGNADGLGAKARFGSPTGIALDDVGNLYVTDGTNRNIRKITSDGKVTTVAGNGDYGHTNGSVYTASFTSPSGIAVDKAGNIYIADTYDNRIRKITPAGEVSTFAGSGSMGKEDGQGEAASFSYPTGMSIDAAGNLYIADSAGNRIRRISTSGVVSTLAGSGLFGGHADGAAATATFNQPIGITIDNAGFIYVAEVRNRLVRKLSPSGQVSTLAGGGDSYKTDGIGRVASFASPKGIAVDKLGNLFLADGTRIRKLAPVAPGP